MTSASTMLFNKKRKQGATLEKLHPDVVDSSFKARGKQDSCEDQEDDVIPLPTDFEPADLDIICGRGRGNYNALGNVRFRNLVRKSVNLYTAQTSKTAKSQVLAAIATQVRYGPDKCRFVKKLQRDGSWVELGENAVREKVGHAMREAQLAMRRCHTTNDESNEQTKKKDTTSSNTNNNNKESRQGREYQRNRKCQTREDVLVSHSVTHDDSSFSSLLEGEMIFQNAAATYLPRSNAGTAVTSVNKNDMKAPLPPDFENDWPFCRERMLFEDDDEYNIAAEEQAFFSLCLTPSSIRPRKKLCTLNLYPQPEDKCKQHTGDGLHVVQEEPFADFIGSLLTKTMYRPRTSSSTTTSSSCATTRIHNDPLHEQAEERQNHCNLLLGTTNVEELFWEHFSPSMLTDKEGEHHDKLPEFPISSLVGGPTVFEEDSNDWMLSLW